MTEPTYLRVQIKNASSDSHSLQPMGNHSITETSPMNHKVSSSFLKISWDLRWIRWQLLLINRQNCYLSNTNTTFHCFKCISHFTVILPTAIWKFYVQLLVKDSWVLLCFICSCNGVLHVIFFLKWIVNN